MKKILPALSNVQMAARDTSRDWAANLGKARQELAAAIREAIVGFAPEVDAAKHPAIAKERADYLAKFDKLFNPE